MFLPTFLVWVTQYSLVIACWGKNEDLDLIKDPRYKELLNGWDPPPGSMKSKRDWMDFYKKREDNTGKQLQQEDLLAGIKPEGHDIPNWPEDWRGMGPGYKGVKHPPPWVYRPINYGRPSACMMPPEYGHCNPGWFPPYRYGYNPILDECISFKYSGCGGNQNNWKTKFACEKHCINPTVGCDIDSHIPVDYTTLS